MKFLLLVLTAVAFLRPTLPGAAATTTTYPRPPNLIVMLVDDWGWTDAGSYGASWDKAAPAFKGAISKPGWEQALRNVRMPLGTVKSRRLASAQFTRSLPGAPAGDYFVLQFATQFENKASAVETVTPMKGPEGNWRVSGYFIK